MKKNRNYILTVLAILLLVLCVVIFALSNQKKEGERYKVAVVVDEDNPNRWNILKQGLDRASVDYNVEISFITVSDSLYPNEQIMLINRQLQNGIDGLILNPVSNKNLVSTIDNVAGQIPVFLMESNITSENIYPCIGADNYKMGMELGEKVCEELVEGQKIGILLGNQSKEGYVERYQGLLDVFTHKKVEVAWQIEKSTTDTSEKMAEFYDYNDQNLVICLGNEATEEAVDFAIANEQKLQIFAIGNTEKVVYYVDRGLIHTLIVPNEFNIGYLAVQEISKQLEYGADGSSINVEYTIVNKENMYNRDIQKVLFPIVQ